jgi:hypothetical protein
MKKTKGTWEIRKYKLSEVWGSSGVNVIISRGSLGDYLFSR